MGLNEKTVMKKKKNRMIKTFLDFGHFQLVFLVL